MQFNSDNPADDFYGNENAAVEPVDKEDDPNLLVDRETPELHHKTLLKLNRKTLNPQQTQHRFKRFLRTGDDATSMKPRFVDQTKDFHAENHLKTRTKVKSGRSCDDAISKQAVMKNPR